MKKLLILIPVILFVASCKDFLEEETKSVATGDSFYSSVNGLEYLVTASYVSNKIWYGKEEGFDFSDIGTDIYTYGQQHPNRNQFTFDPTFNSYNGRITILWVEFYKGVNACNEALYYLNDPTHPMPDAQKAKRKAEILFLRSHYFWLLTEIWGDIPMPVERTIEPTFVATKVAVKDVYQQILQDVNTAFDLLGDSDNVASGDFGRVTKDAVRAFRARINLAVASYMKHAGNPFAFEGVANDHYTQALNDAKELIAKYALYDNYADMWKLENNTTNRNREGIWAVNYSRSIYAMLNINIAEYQNYFTVGQKPFDEREGGHHGHLMFGTQYDFGNGSGMVRDLTYGRPFRRYAPNKYLIDAYKDSIDARFEEQFRTAWLANSTSAPTTAVYPKWGDFELPADFIPPGGASAPIFIKGDTSMVITKKKIKDNRVVKHKQIPARYLYLDGPYLIWDYNLLFDADGSINEEATGDHNWFIQLKKFDDPQRAVPNGTGSQNGARDAYVFRVAEMYLIAAEAAMELGQDSYAYLLPLAEARAKTGVTGAQLLEAYGIFGNGDITIEKLLDERAREFPGEQLRWFDLKRLHSPQAFVARINKYNPDTDGNMLTHHYLRPIPQVQIDALQNKTEFLQNQGY